MTPIWLEGAGAALPVAPARPVLWLLDLDEPMVRALAEAVTPLPGEAEAFARHPDAGERLLRRRLARHLLAAASGTRAAEVAIGHDPLGAPVVGDPSGWHLSVAARWPACLVGIARESIGVDVEVATTPLPDDLLTALERKALAEVPQADRALAGATAWAAKEAHAKWTGRPRQLDPATVETGEAEFVTSSLGRSGCWRRTSGELAVAICGN